MIINTDWFKKINTYFSKKNLAILFALGIVLMIIPGIFEGTKKDTETHLQNEIEYNEKALKKELESILSKIEGAGKVEVMIVFENSFEKIIAKDTKSVINDEDNKKERNVEGTTVMIKEGNKQTPFVIKELYPSVRGVLVVAEGANDANVRTNIKNAVKTVLNVGIHKVEVLTKKHGG